MFLSIPFEGFMAYLCVGIVCLIFVVMLFCLYLYHKQDDDTFLCDSKNEFHFHFSSKDNSTSR